MSDTLESLRRRIASATELQSVVRTMKALAASSIGQYEQSVLSLSDYYKTVELGLRVCIRELGSAGALAGGTTGPAGGSVGAVVFGSDQGLVGQFNDEVAAFAGHELASASTEPFIWAVGERVNERLADAELVSAGYFAVPNSVNGVTALVGQILLEIESHTGTEEITELFLFYNKPLAGSMYQPVKQQLLPLDVRWRSELEALPWPTKNLPEVIGDRLVTFRALIREYLFVSLFRASAESLASENASRLAAMQRADKSIDDTLLLYGGAYHQLRQRGIDDELFEVVAGFDALSS